MKYLGLVEKLRGSQNAVFSLQELEALFPETTQKTIKNNLTNWVRRGRVRRLRRNLYEVVVPGHNNVVPEFYIANRLYTPSYVSLEAALSFYGIIPEEAAAVSSVTTKPTREFRNHYGIFTYRTCKKEVYTGYCIMKIEGCRTLIADPEKALADYIYFRLRGGETDFSHERFNLSKINKRKAVDYARLYNQKTHRILEDLLK